MQQPRTKRNRTDQEDSDGRALQASARFFLRGLLIIGQTMVHRIRVLAHIIGPQKG